jgi:hypothetical protein
LQESMPAWVAVDEQVKADIGIENQSRG